MVFIAVKICFANTKGLGSPHNPAQPLYLTVLLLCPEAKHLTLVYSRESLQLECCRSHRM